MKHLFTNCFRTIACGCLVLLSLTQSYASHIVGTDLYYTHISDSTYKITLALYGDCASAGTGSAYSLLPTSVPVICVFDGTTTVTSISLAVDTPASGIEINNSCAGSFTTQCSDLSTIIPGIKKFTYSAVYTLPHTSTSWKFKFHGALGVTTAGRAAPITNLASPGSTTMGLEATLNSTVINSSPDLTVSQQSYFCLGSPQTYGPAAVDADGDVLTYSLISASNASAVSGGCTDTAIATTYVSPYTAATPLSCAAGSFALNTTTGNMTFTPNILQRAVVVYNIEERRAGILVGTSQREMTVLVITCSGGPCGTSGTGVPTTQTENPINVYPNPAQNELNISITQPGYNTAIITNAIGKAILITPITSTATTINTANLPTGLYYLQLKGDGISATQKINIVQ